jgi:hypothetical protein
LQTSCQPDDLAQLRAAFPGWEFEARWTVAGTGPDSRVLLAHHGDVTVSAWTADSLAEQVRHEETGRS